jgi:hypothetical protein
VRLARIRIFAALGALAFPSYRRSKFSGENALIFAVFTRDATTRGSQKQLQNFSDRLPANAVLQPCKYFKVIHGSYCSVSTCHLLFGRLAHGATSPGDVKNHHFRTCKNFRTIHDFFDWIFLLLHSYLLDWLTAGLIPLPFQPVGVCVEYRIILQQDI